MKQRDSRGAAARLCALRQDRRTLLVVVITTVLALCALARGRVGLATTPAARKHPFRAATVATQGPDEHTAALNDSCFQHHGFQVELIGVGGAWEGKSNLAHSKLDHEYRWLKSLHPDTLAMIIDGGDVLCWPCGRDVVAEYWALGGGIIMGGDLNPWPDPEIERYFPPPPRNTSVFRYLNAGTKLGIAGDFVHFLETNYFGVGRHHDANYAEQRFWQDQFLATQPNQYEPARSPRVTIDYDGAVFQVLSGELWSERCWVYDPAASTVATVASAACQAKMYSRAACILHAPGPTGKQALLEIVLVLIACRTQQNMTCDQPIQLPMTQS